MQASVTVVLSGAAQSVPASLWLVSRALMSPLMAVLPAGAPQVPQPLPKEGRFWSLALRKCLLVDAVSRVGCTSPAVAQPGEARTTLSRSPFGHSLPPGVAKDGCVSAVPHLLVDIKTCGRLKPSGCSQLAHPKGNLDSLKPQEWAGGRGVSPPRSVAWGAGPSARLGTFDKLLNVCGSLVFMWENGVIT